MVYAKMRKSSGIVYPDSKAIFERKLCNFLLKSAFMRIIILIMGLFVMACNNSSQKKTDIKDTGKEDTRMPATTIMPDTIFFGLGTEPFWAVYIIKDSKIIFHPAEGPEVEAPFVAPSIVNNTTTYHSSAGGSSIDLVITKKACSDGMSDNVHTYEVMLTVNKTKYSGCGNDY